MKFDSNKAWLDAMAAVRANRQVLLPVAGVFLLLPSLLATVFLSDVQVQMVAAMHKREVAERILMDNLGLVLGFGMGGMLVQSAGTLALMALLSDRARPTVGEAIMIALRALPTLIATMLLTILGMFVASTLLGLAVGLLFGLVAGTSVASAVFIVTAVMLTAYVAVKCSLVVPVVVKEANLNPFAVLARSWRLTRHNSLRLFGFFVLLATAYVVVAFVTMMALVAPVALLVGEGQGVTLFTGVVSGAVGAISGVILTAVLAHVHRQLAGASPMSWQGPL